MVRALPFRPGDLVVALLQSPRERLWGRLLDLDASGFALRGVDLSPWEEILTLVRTGEADQVALATRFIPMHRLETLYLDEPSSGAPSLSETFRERTGREAVDFLGEPPSSTPPSDSRRNP
ncbi:hypothetical protein [Geothrix sp. 21YS21S-4]|uniref:hypothetical protein n=1 Tax=Geothrix sp. 21YS21S-4 TaxID=3068889 RepID=UPI0027B969D4|nr:hypothetical protein [Geothrix sp. 21YS21S-4]